MQCSIKLQEHNYDSTKQIVHAHMPLGFFSVDVFMCKIRSKIIRREYLEETERKQGRIKNFTLSNNVNKQLIHVEIHLATF